MEKPQQYRILGPEEIIQEGDEISCMNYNNWGLCKTTIGKLPVDSGSTFKFRRPIPAKSATVECPGPDCSMCNGEYCATHGPHPCGCDVIDRHKSGNGKPDGIPDYKKEFETALAAMKLRAEKAEALRDAAYDERNAAMVIAKDSSKIRLAEWCRDERASGSGGCGACSICNDETIKERDELRFKLQTAERERDEANTKLKDLADLAAELGKESETLKLDKQIAESAANIAKKERGTLRAEKEAVSKGYADYIEKLDTLLDERKIPNRDGVGRAGPYQRVYWLLERYKDEKAANARLREALEKIANAEIVEESSINPEGLLLVTIQKTAQAALAEKGESKC